MSSPNKFVLFYISEYIKEFIRKNEQQNIQ